VPLTDARLRERVYRALNKPYYLLRPTQVAHRLRRPRGHDPVTVRLPWGSSIRVRPDDLIGGSIVRTGVYDLSVSEALARLIDPGDVVVDVGANVGYMTNLSASRVGADGRVIAIEPHPEIYEELIANVDLVTSSGLRGVIETMQTAVSELSGEAFIVDSREFAGNRGSAQLQLGESAAGGSHRHRVSVRTLDEILAARPYIGVLKIDVEEHELQALRGAGSLLAEKRIRDVVFEDHRSPPTPVTDFLEEKGYRIFRLRQRFLGLRAEPLDRRGSTSLWDPPSYVATTHPDRTLRRLTATGWKTLRG